MFTVIACIWNCFQEIVIIFLYFLVVLVSNSGLIHSLGIFAIVVWCIYAHAIAINIVINLIITNVRVPGPKLERALKKNGADELVNI